MNKLSIDDSWRISVEGIDGDNFDQLRAIALQLHDTMRENEWLRSALEFYAEDNAEGSIALKALQQHKDSEYEIPAQGVPIQDGGNGFASKTSEGKISDYWRDIINGLKAPPLDYEYIIDPKIGDTIRKEKPVVFTPSLPHDPIVGYDLSSER